MERRLTSARAAGLLAFLIAGLVVAFTIRYNTFAAWATDSGAYLAAGYAWARGDLFTPATFVWWAPWSADGQAEFPFGHVQGPIKGTITGQYPLGYPLLIAVALKTGTDLAPHLVSPVLAGVLAWCAFLLGRQMATPWAGVFGALLIGATPVVLSHSVMMFSDVPAAAFWAVAWAMSVRPGHGAALASGAAAAFAVLIRPNLAPLALVIAATVALAEREGWKRALTRVLAFGTTGVLGPLFVLWSQDVLYGHPLQSGYRVSMDFFFDLERVPYNAGLYPRMLGQLHSWVVFGGLAFVPFAVRGMRASRAAYLKGLLAASATALIVVNYALYLPYLTYVGWDWLRFVLPAMLALFLLLTAGLDHLRLWLWPRWGVLSLMAFAPALLVGWWGETHIRPPAGYARIHAMERYLPSVLPPNAVVLTYAHGGAIANATRRPILRIDVIESDTLDRVVRDLQRRGLRPVYIFDVDVDGDLFAYRFKGAALGRLTWPARAEIADVTSIVYYDIKDRDAFFSGERWPTDVLVAGRSVHGNVRWHDMRADRERIILPVLGELFAFRSQLEVIYRGHLGRPAVATAIDSDEALRWLGRYLRLRLHGCSHEAASARLWEQLAKGIVPSLCAAPDAVRFPPEDETTQFRQELEQRLAGRIVRQPPTSVDSLGEVVWMQRYLEHRVRGCSHEDAAMVVTQRITGSTVRACP